MTLSRGKISAEQQAAAAELLRRRKARSSFIDFATYMLPSFEPEPFHVAVGSILDRVLARQSQRIVIVEAPPQHGKSLTISQLFPAFHLGNRPHEPVLSASFTIDIARRNSRDTRDYVESVEFRALFGDLGPQDVDPVEIREDSREVTEWRLKRPFRGGLRAAGIGGSLTGYAGSLGIIDDPIKSMEAALSPTWREKTWEWFQTVFETRFGDTGVIVLMLTRWHEDDLAGRIISQYRNYELHRFPALAETQQERDANNLKLGLPAGLPDPLGRAPEDPLAPKRRSKDYLLGIRSSNPRRWHAMYQGVPRPSEGNRFKRAWLKGEDGEYIVSAVPQFADRIRYWDKAGTEGAGAYTAGVLLAVKDGLIYVEDVVRGQWSARNREQMMKETAERDDAKYGNVQIWIEQEPGSGGKESAEATIQNLAGYSVRADPPVGNKDARLDPFAAQAEAGNVRLLRGDWNEDYIEELISIPNGVYRDQADATAGAFNKLTKPEGTVRRTKVRRSNW